MNDKFCSPRVSDAGVKYVLLHDLQHKHGEDWVNKMAKEYHPHPDFGVKVVIIPAKDSSHNMLHPQSGLEYESYLNVYKCMETLNS